MPRADHRLTMADISMRSRGRTFWRVLAATYTTIALLALVFGWPGISDDPVGLVPAVVLGMPWALLMQLPPEGPWPGLAVISGALALNAVLLWWWALRRG